MQNLQARIRGAILMALSNRHGRLLLTTGNKSEIATGYCTLYGDMAGGLAVISDVPKTLVYQLAREINRERAVIPEATLTKAPSAELRPNQTDQDSLPPYDAAGRDPGRAPGTGAGLAGAGGGRVRRRDRERRGAPRATQRVQTAPDAARSEDHRQGLRPRPAHADRPGLEGVTEALDVQLGHCMFRSDMRAVVAVLPGDGIGPEVVAQATEVLAAVAKKMGPRVRRCARRSSAAARSTRPAARCRWRRWSCVAAPTPCCWAPSADPKWDDPKAKVRPEQGLLAIRKGLGLYANLRPVSVNPKLIAASPLRPELLVGVDLVVVRELTGGIYFGDKLREKDRAVDTCVYTEAEVTRIVRSACELARGRRRKLTSVDKANVLETSRLWREVTERVVKRDFPDVTLSHMLVDACAMHLIRRPADFDVIVTENMFGDILTDEASMLVGSMGMLPSASLGEGKRGLYEPIHGSAPDIAGKGIANPYATILSLALLLRHSLGLSAEAAAVEAAVGVGDRPQRAARRRGARWRDAGDHGPGRRGRAREPARVAVSQRGPRGAPAPVLPPKPAIRSGFSEARLGGAGRSVPAARGSTSAAAIGNLDGPSELSACCARRVSVRRS